MKIVVNIGAAEFSAIKDGEKPFYVHRSKVPPKIGQGILFQCPEVDEDLELTISCVHDEPGIHKGYYIVSFQSKDKAKCYIPGTTVQSQDGSPDIVLGTKEELEAIGYQFPNDKGEYPAFI